VNVPERPHAEPPPADAVLVDVGPGAGAVVVLVDPALVGARIDLVGADGSRTHVDVHERRDELRVLAAAVFGSVTPGHHAISIGGRDPRTAKVRVVAGRVAQIDLREASRPA
jgi:hypothetical protein